MNRNILTVHNVRINLEEDVVFKDDVLIGSFTDFKAQLLFAHRETCMKYKLCTKYNFDKEGTIRYIIAWDSVIGELIKEGKI